MSQIKLVSDTIDQEEIQSLISWLSQSPTPQLTKGPLTKQLEEKWSKWLGVNNTTYVNSGSSAILLMLYTLLQSKKISKPAKIVVPSLSWITDVSSPMQIGLEVLLCDCNLTDLSVDLNHLEQIFKTEKPEAFILVHILGLIPNMKLIMDLCTKYNVILLEDVCESMGSEYENKKLGTFGEMSVFSLYYGHHLSTIEGGFVCTNSKELSNISLMLRNHGWDRDLSLEDAQTYRKQYNISEFQAQYTFYYPGFNLRATDLQAFIGLNQIDKLDKIRIQREFNYFMYLQNIKSNMLDLSPAVPHNLVSNFAFPMLHENRENIVKALIDDNIEVRPLIAGSMGNKPFWIKEYGKTPLPNCDIIDKYGFYLPNHADLSKADILRVTEIVNKNS